MTALKIKNPLVMLPFVVCERGRLVSDGEYVQISCLKDGKWLDLFATALPWTDMRTRGMACGIDIQIGEFSPKE